MDVKPSLLTRVRNFLAPAQKSLAGNEGDWRGPFYGAGEFGSIFQYDRLEDGWQRNITYPYMNGRKVPTVYSCVMAISRAISQCYPTHVRKEDNGSFTQITNSAAYRVLNKPNSYQSGSLFLLNLVAQALFEGESFALGLRNDRNEISSAHLLPPRSVSVYASDGEIFYSISKSNDLLPSVDNIDYLVPARDILHLRFHTPRHPLIGESAIKAAALALGINVSLSVSQAAFFSRMNRPSGILSTDEKLQKDQMLRLRQAFDEQSKSWQQGGIPILSNGLKFQSMSVNSQDSQLVEAQRMSIHEICRVFGVPPALIGEVEDATLNNSETLIQYFMSLSLGSYLEITEREFDRFFGLGPKEYVEFDTSALLRTDFERRIAGLTKAVQGGVMTPNEARGREGLSPIEGGNSAFLQRQMVPIDLISELAAADVASENEPPPQDPIDEDEGEEELEEEKAVQKAKQYFSERFAA